MSDDITYTQHTVQTDALDTLGNVLDPEDFSNPRDAIHLAVFRVKANQDLLPGDHVVLADDEGEWASRAPNDEGVGIVDPFIRGTVRKGQYFWLVVYPRQIASLRHVWEHPAFPESGESFIEAAPTTRKESEAWLRNFVSQLDTSISMETIVGHAVDNTGRWPMSFNDDIYGEIPPEFWIHVENYTGKPVLIPVDQRPEYFSCAC